MSYLKRQKIPKNWPIPRKGNTYIVNPKSKGIPVLVIFRDMLKLARNKKEVKKSIHAKQILLNGKSIRDEKIGITLFDVLTIVSSKQHYKLDLSDKGKFKLEKLKKEEAGKKIAKIIGKKMLKNKKIQINLNDGTNFLSDIKCNVQDSVIINFKDRKIEKCLPLKEKQKVIVFGGKHSGEKGIINKIDPKLGSADLSEKGKKVSVLIKQLMVIE
jgi:small subunit ribosomal protein S4e